MAALVAAVSVLAACGSSSSVGLNVAPTFSLAGTTYTPKDGGGLTVNNKTCTTTQGPLTFSAVVAGFSSFTGLCGWVKSNTICASKQNSQFGSIAVIKGSATGPGPIQPGVYQVGTTVDATGVTIVDVSFANLDNLCHPGATYAGMTGSVTITQTTPTVKGSAAVTFVDAVGATVGGLTGSFDVNTCDYQLDLCGELAGTCTSTGNCIP